MASRSASLPAVLSLAAALALGCPPAAEEPAAGGAPAGKWRPARAADPPAADLGALPYLQGYRPARERPLVTRHDPEATAAGLNLYTSGHAAEALLVGMDGAVRHRWRYPLRRLWPDLAADPENARIEYFRRAHLFPNGDLLAIYEGQGLVKLDAASRVLWAYRGGAHHDLHVTPAGEIWLLDREGRVLPRIDPRRGVLEDQVTLLAADGRLLRRISILEAFEGSEFAPLLRAMPAAGDLLHTNTLEVLDGRFAALDPAFRAGNVLLSVLNLDALAVLDPRAETIVWARTGTWRRQHQPTFLDDGRLLLFDNLGAGPGRSRILELDPSSGEVSTVYDVDLFSKTLGSCQRLWNGNTLITESENGRAIEVTRGGRVVWEFNSPHRAGPRSELVATLFEVLRLPPDFRFSGTASLEP